MQSNQRVERSTRAAPGGRGRCHGKQVSEREIRRNANASTYIVTD